MLNKNKNKNLGPCAAQYPMGHPMQTKEWWTKSECTPSHNSWDEINYWTHSYSHVICQKIVGGVTSLHINVSSPHNINMHMYPYNKVFQGVDDDIWRILYLFRTLITYAFWMYLFVGSHHNVFSWTILVSFLLRTHHASCWHHVFCLKLPQIV